MKHNGFITHRTFHLFNTLNAELNPICHLLALLGAHHILHVSRRGVNNLLYQTLKQFPVHSIFLQHKMRTQNSQFVRLISTIISNMDHGNR